MRILKLRIVVENGGRMISIVLPVYNGEEYLEQSINSILNQTYKDFELVIVNDCSTDSTLKIVEKYLQKDSRIRLINNDINQRLPKSLNIGFSQCKGDYFTWTSDDNLMMPNALETLIKALEESNSDLAFSRCETIDIKGNKIGETELYSDLNELYCNNIVLASFLYKKCVHEKLNGYDISKFLVEDYDFWLRAYRSFKFIYVPEILYKIRFHGENLGTKHFEDVKLRKIELLKENLNFVSDLKIIDSIYREISICYFQASDFYYGKLKQSTNKNIVKVFRIKDIIKKILGR